MPDQNNDDKDVKGVESPFQTLGNALDSGLVRSVLAVPIVIVLHLIIDRLMEEWTVLQMFVSAVFLINPAVAWVFWPNSVLVLLSNAWKLCSRGVDPIESRVSPEVIKSVSAADIDNRMRYALGHR